MPSPMQENTPFAPPATALSAATEDRQLITTPAPRAAS